MLDGITAWMAVNSEGIYGTRPWKIYGEGPSTQAKIETGNFNEDKQKDLTAEDIRFTTKGSTLYAFVMGWPERKRWCRRSASPARKIRARSTALKCLDAKTISSGNRSNPH